MVSSNYREVEGKNVGEQKRGDIRFGLILRAAASVRLWELFLAFCD